MDKRLPDVDRTIAALATAPGASALAVVRLTGPRAFAVAAAFTSPPQKDPPHKLVRMVDLTDGKTQLDRAVAVYFRGPNSYTGQDTVEITCHGSPYITRSALNLAVKAGAGLAEPGEFTLRAYLNGKLDLAQAEAVGSLVASTSAAAHRAALAQVRGDLSRKVEDLKARTVHLLAQLEARLDDSYEETAELDQAAFAGEACGLRDDALQLAAGFEAGRGIREGIKVAIAGAPNSGKSSLLNAMLGYARALVSPEAGTTRDTLEAQLELHGFTVHFTDTAGLNAEPGGKLEREGMARAEKAMREADIVLLLKDASVKTSPSDLLARLTVKKLKTPELIEVLTKTDLPVKVQQAKALKTSCRTGAGLDALRRAIVARQVKLFREGGEAPVTFARHYRALRAAAAELERLIDLLRGKKPPLELAAEHLRGALGELGAILGETAPDEVLADIFKNFCVGK